MASDQKPAGLTRDIEHEILRAIQAIRFGSVEIIIQDSRIIQIERKEKVRFDRAGGLKGDA